MNKYVEVKEQNLEDINNFKIGYAFNQKQFKDALKNVFEIKPEEAKEKLVSIGAGGFILKAELDDFKKMLKNNRERIANNYGDEEFLFDMFKYELANHEYGYTQEIEDTLEDLGLTYDDIENNSLMFYALQDAMAELSGEM